VIEIHGWKRWSFWLTVIGANSIAIYVMSWTLEHFVSESLKIHLGSAPFLVFGPPFEPVLRGVRPARVLGNPLLDVTGGRSSYGYDPARLALLRRGLVLLAVLLHLDLEEARERAIGPLLVAAAAVEPRQRVPRLRVVGVEPGRLSSSRAPPRRGPASPARRRAGNGPAGSADRQRAIRGSGLPPLRSDRVA
jgi:hypothetical protein